jgi:acyl-CoA hydrolase
MSSSLDAFAAWLDKVTLTKPVTLADKAELKALIKKALEALEVKVDVYSQRDPDEIYVRVEYPDHLIERTFRAVA